MTTVSNKKREVKQLSKKLDIEYEKLKKRIENFDREKRQLSIIQQNVQNVQRLSTELLGAVEKIRLRQKGN